MKTILSLIEKFNKSSLYCMMISKLAEIDQSITIDDAIDALSSAKYDKIELKRKFKQLAHLFHPDKYQNESIKLKKTKEFQLLKEVYEALLGDDVDSFDNIDNDPYVKKENTESYFTFVLTFCNKQYKPIKTQSLNSIIDVIKLLDNLLANNPNSYYNVKIDSKANDIDDMLNGYIGTLFFDDASFGLAPSGGVKLKGIDKKTKTASWNNVKIILKETFSAQIQ